jgi:hypothetical protein
MFFRSGLVFGGSVVESSENFVISFDVSDEYLVGFFTDCHFLSQLSISSIIISCLWFLISILF